MLGTRLLRGYESLIAEERLEFFASRYAMSVEYGESEAKRNEWLTKMDQALVKTEAFKAYKYGQ